MALQYRCRVRHCLPFESLRGSGVLSSVGARCDRRALPILQCASRKAFGEGDDGARLVIAGRGADWAWLSATSNARADWEAGPLCTSETRGGSPFPAFGPEVRLKWE